MVGPMALTLAFTQSPPAVGGYNFMSGLTAGSGIRAGAQGTIAK